MPTMPAAGYAVTKGARRITRKAGSLTARMKALANRRNRRSVRVQVHVQGADADVQPKLFTDWDVA